MDKISTNGSMIEQIDLARANRSGFDMSFNNYLTGKLGALIPTRVQEILPGDRIKGNTQMVVNFEPLIQPMLANMYAKQESFYIPLRQIWSNADRFFTGKRGFEKNVPSVTLKRICQTLNLSNLLPQSLDSYESIEDNLTIVSLLDDYKNYLVTFGDTYLVKDLFIPLFALIKDCSDYYIDNSHWNVNKPWEENISYYLQYLEKVSNFWTNISSLSDYLGIAAPVYRIISDTDTHEVAIVPTVSEIPLNWLPFRAAYMVWYWYYRDKILEESAPDPEDYMTDTVADIEIPLMLLLRHRCWSKDTFTTALTNTGSGNVIVPILGTQNYKYINPKTDNTSDGGAAADAGADVYKVEIGGKYYMLPNQYLATDKGTLFDNDGQAISLDLIERAKRLSTWLAKRLILGVEYDDVVYSSFMVKLSSVRMHIPELLDSSRSVVSMNTLVNNTKSDGSVMGDKAAVAWCNDSSQGFNYFAEEHGYLLSFMSIMPEQSYMHGISRKFLRQNRFDFAWPEFSQIGMDAIYNIELTAEDLTNDDNALQVFGYQGRYYDYKCNQNEEHGLIRTTLDYLTFSRKFSLDETKDNYPLLNPYFVHCFPSLDMFVMEDQNEDVFRADIHHAFAMERCLPVPSDEIY